MYLVSFHLFDKSILLLGGYSYKEVEGVTRNNTEYSFLGNTGEGLSVEMRGEKNNGCSPTPIVSYIKCHSIH